MKILIVDDNPNDRKILKYNLEHRDCELIEAQDGQEGIEMASKHRPDIIISDAMMPGVDGFQFLRVIKQDQALKSIPFIFYTATYIGHREAELAISLGAEAYIIKPKDPEELWKELVEILEDIKQKKEKRLTAELIEEDEKFLKIYSQIVVKKLEEKVSELEDEIVKRKQVEESLRQSEEKYRSIIENIYDFIYSAKTDGTITFITPNVSAWGYTPEEIIGHNLMEFIHPDDVESVTQDFQRTITTGEEFPSVARLRMKNGDYLYIEEYGTVLREGSEIVRITGSIRDITERKKAEEELSKLMTAVEYSADWILITDRQGTIEYVNKAVENISGYAKTDLIGKNPRIFKSGKHGVELYSKLWNTILSGATFSGVFVNRRKTGELFELHYTITPLIDQSGAVHHLVATAKDMTAEKLLEERLDFIAYYDPLTGLPNRKLFTDRLSQSLRSAEQQGARLAILLVDIDRFTSLNETYGYETGDEILKEVGNRFSHNLCGDCTLGRIEADKFGLALANIKHSEDVILALEKMRSIFKEPLRVGREDIIITVSVGIALFPEDGNEPESLMGNAEVALAEAKAGGTNMYQFFTPDINKIATDFIRMQRNLFEALEKEEYVMHYQPYFDSTTREMVGIEALVRWNSPKFGFVSPGKFIPILEETGMIIDVGKWIIHTVCRQIKDWIDKGYESSMVPVYINLSLAQFAQKDLSDFIEETIRETGIYSGLLGFEVTESIFMQDLKHTQAVLEKLRQKDIAVNIDDFGTGYSSLSNLKRLPVNNLKIDISFIRDVTNNPDDASIVITIISLAHNLNMKTIAEGVETEEQWKILRILKCDIVQGYYFCKPALPQDIEKFFRQ